MAESQHITQPYITDNNVNPHITITMPPISKPFVFAKKIKHNNILKICCISYLVTYVLACIVVLVTRNLNVGVPILVLSMFLFFISIYVSFMKSGYFHHLTTNLFAIHSLGGINKHNFEDKFIKSSKLYHQMMLVAKSFLFVGGILALCALHAVVFLFLYTI